MHVQQQYTAVSWTSGLFRSQNKKRYHGKTMSYLLAQNYRGAGLDPGRVSAARTMGVPTLRELVWFRFKGTRSASTGQVGQWTPNVSAHLGLGFALLLYPLYYPHSRKLYALGWATHDTPATTAGALELLPLEASTNCASACVCVRVCLSSYCRRHLVWSGLVWYL